MPELSAPHRAVLDKLTELGAERAPLVARRAYMRSDGRAALDKIYVKARKLIERGVELQLLHDEMRERLGVSSAAYYKIKSGETGA